MKRLIFVLLAIALMIGTATAGEWTETGICYQATLGESGMLIVDTAVQLTHEKDQVAQRPDQVEKMANDIGKSLYGRLMKLPDVSNVVIAPRQIAVRVFPYPPNAWEKLKDPVLAEIDQLCLGDKSKGKKSKKER